MHLSKLAAALLALILAVPSAAVAQDATFSGQIVDGSGAAVPGATVVLINSATSIATETVSNAQGFFSFPSTRPGPYELLVTLAGFAPYTLNAIRLEVGERRTVTVTLEPGQLKETVTVTAETTPLSTARADRSVVVENRFVTSIPLNIRNPLQMINNAVGVTPAMPDSGNNTLSQSRTNTFRINGAKASTTDIQLDGAANITAYANQAASVPQVDAVQEFRVVTAGYAPEYGRTSGGLALFALRSGTNRLQGTLHEFARNERFDSNGFNANRAGQQKQDFRRHQYGFTLGGPLRIPGMYEGRDRTFLFIAYEGLRETRAGSYTGTVPTALERAGDFSQTRDAQGNLITIYDPRTTRLDPARPAGTTRYIRDPFPGNRIPAEMLNPIALNILRYFPSPNQPGDGLSNTNNYYSNAPSGLDTDRVDVRADHNLTNANRLALRFNYFQNRIKNPDVYGNGMTLIANNRIPGINTMARHTLVRPSLVFEHHLSFAQSQSNRTSGNLSFTPTSLGFPNSVIDGNPITTFPLVTGNRMGQIGTQVALERNGSKIFQYLASTSWLRGSHMVKFGFDTRSYPIRLSSAPQLTIRAASNFTGGPNPQAAVAASGSGIADLLLGAAAVSNGVFEPEFINHRYYAAYIQDEFRATSTLTLTYGLRYNVEPSWTEKHGTLVNLDLESPAAIASQLPHLNLKGGVGFVGGGEPTQEADINNLDPRVGAAYQLTSKTVLHGGFGVFHHPSPSYLAAGTSVGASRITNSVTTEPDTVTPLFNLSNPFPTGLLPAIGSSQGLATLLGQNIAGAPRQQTVSYQTNWSFDVQRELPGNMVVTVGYSGNVGRNLLSPVNLNQLPDEALALGTQLLQQVANPFFGVITDPTSLLSRPTVQAGQLLRPYPHLLNVTEALAGVGRSRYHALQLTVDRRFSDGLGMVFAYTKSKTMDNVGEVGLWVGDASGFQNNHCFECDWSLSLQDVPDVIRWSMRYDLPFGPGRTRLTSGPLAQVLGGWAVGSFFTWDNGTPVRLMSPNDSNSFGGGTNMRPNTTGESPVIDDRGPLVDGALFFNPAAFSRTPSFTFGNAPRAIPGVRNPGTNNWDLLIEKRVELPGSAALDLRAEIFNAFNYVQFAGPGTNIAAADFGRIFLRQVNTPRQIQFGARMSF
jgi:Carboxypeptidase regulatory-like domain